MRRLNLTVLLACATLIAGCASRPPLSAVARIEMPAEAVRPCSLYVLPEAPSVADLELGYATRGAQLVACNAARDLAVQTQRAERALTP